MTTIRLNGEERRLDDGATVQHALDLLNVTPDSRGVAVAVDREVVPRGDWARTSLHEGAAVEVVMAIQEVEMSTVDPTDTGALDAAAAADPLTIAGRAFRSRLLLGTGGFQSLEAMAEAIAVSGSELVTVALRRIDPAAAGSIMDVIADAGVAVLPNTAGCYTARDAVTTARSRARRSRRTGSSSR